MGKQSWNHVNGTTPVGIRSYTFSYDGLNRIKTAAYSGQGNESFGIPNINYDRNGNITQLQRNGKTGGSFGLMDNLTYSYTGNRLTSVTDAVSGNYEVDFVKRGSGGYTYQVNGALKTDENEEITNIVYNTYLNLPEEITLTGGRWIKYTYDGEGKLLKTEYSTGEYWEYVDEFVFKNGQPYQVAIADGRARYESGNWVNEFDYKDHLGNTRVSFKEGTTGAELTAKTDFDPWGVRLNGTGTVNSFQNRWELQGKEKEMTFNLNRINFGARVYNPTIGRWDKVDPLAEVSRRWSPYNYAYNNPLLFIDPDGMLADYYDKDGTYLGNDGIDDNKVYQLKNNYRVRFENTDVNWGGTLSEKHYTELQAKSNDLGTIQDAFVTGDAVSDKRIQSMHPAIRMQATDFIKEANANSSGTLIRIAQGFRTYAEQDALYAQGRTAPGSIVTKAQGGFSNHNFGLAFDIVGITNGKMDYNLDWKSLSTLGKSKGFEWGGNWKFKDMPHFENMFGNSLKELRALPKDKKGLPILKP